MKPAWSGISLKWLFVIPGIGGALLLSLIILERSEQGADMQRVPSADGPPVEKLTGVYSPESLDGMPEEVRAPLPIRLVIPKMHVDAALEYVGLTKAGAMDVPKGPASAAWYDLGPRPGEGGSAVIAGHYGWKNNIPAVFDDLFLLEKGDKLYVVDEKGATSTFTVRQVRTYGENDDATDVFGAGDGNAHLNLVTCKGVWNKGKKSYSERLVVFADKEFK